MAIDEPSIIPSDLWADIDSKFWEILVMIPDKAFASLSTITVVDFLQLTPVTRKVRYSQCSDRDNIKYLLYLSYNTYLNMQNYLNL